MKTMETSIEKHHLQNIEENHIEISEATEDHPKIYWMHREFECISGHKLYTVFGKDANNNDWIGSQYDFGEDDFSDVDQIEMQ